MLEKLHNKMSDNQKIFTTGALCGILTCTIVDGIKTIISIFKKLK